ncbi:penicillin acylase family protein [Erwinia piriflorinigrans]|uniref:Penicillin amidase n=1 Tax=Erwinia piriflorinigrans CFBP 5888 TaxID=1161919 RepID=V5ZDI5_9GAMM|nr:penicillin acylase family protein [Erwinia piriflorinigrans]CCG89141.1 penicillin amidase [Erwinia piriflorinigrans CFBP 5888]
MVKILRRTGKIALMTMGVIAVLVVLAGAVAGVALYQSLPQREGTQRVSGLNGQATIQRDPRGVPDISASNSQQAWFALGFLHAQDRFFQMDLLRRSAAGELAELVGKSGLTLDRQRRIFQLRAQARHALSQLPASQRQRLTGYTAGVNAGLHALQSRPFEYWVLRTSPQPWHEEDSLLVIAAMYFDLQGNQAGREYARGWIADNNAQQQAFLLPEASRWDRPLAGSVPAAAAIPTSAPAWWGQAHVDSASALPDEGMKGSNGWLLSRNGKAILANDMHLGLGLPGIWYQARINQSTQKRSLTGITLPGLPLLLSGSNGHIAWGFTNSYVDTFDWVVADKTMKTETHTEMLRVNQGKSQTLTLRSSQWGPVVTTPRGDMAMHWVLQLPGALNLNLAMLDDAESVPSALAAGKQAGIPAQNLLVADSQGNIGWTLAGTLADRSTAGEQTRSPVRASAENRWQPLPAAAHPQAINPADGMIVTANNRLLFDRQGERLGDGGADIGVRASAITQRLTKQTDADEKQMYRLQLNDEAPLAAVWRDWLLKSLANPQQGEDPAYEQMRSLLRQWNGHADADSTGYALIAQWRDDMYASIFGGLDNTLSQQWPQAYYRRANPRWDETMLALMNAEKWVPPGSADWQAWTRSTLADSWKKRDSGKTRWGEINRSDYAHPLAKALPVVGHYLRSPSVALSGDNNVIHVNRPRFGASERMVVSPGEESQAILSLPSGQSGHPLSRWWMDSFPAWVRGEAQPMLPGPPAYQLGLKGDEVR